MNLVVFLPSFKIGNIVGHRVVNKVSNVTKDCLGSIAGTIVGSPL